MRVAYDSRPAGEQLGVGRYAGSLLDALRRSGRGEIVETHHPHGVDVYHAPWAEGALLRPPVPMIVTVHDLVALKRPGEYLRAGLRFRLRSLAVQRATRVIVPTATVAADAERTLAIGADHIVVIPEAPAPVFRARPDSEVAAVRERFELPADYLLWVGDMRIPDPRKRVAALARTARTLPLVLVGPAARWARELPDVLVTGAVADDELAAIYTGARALVFPSDEEGFGLPPLEALACGTPVAACRAPGVADVLEGLVPLTPLGDLGALVEAAQRLRRPAPDPPRWSWDDAAEATWEVYEAALGDPVRFRGARRHPRGPASSRSSRER